MKFLCASGLKISENEKDILSQLMCKKNQKSLGRFFLNRSSLELFSIFIILTPLSGGISVKFHWDLSYTNVNSFQFKEIIPRYTRVHLQPFKVKRSYVLSGGVFVMFRNYKKVWVLHFIQVQRMNE